MISHLSQFSDNDPRDGRTVRMLFDLIPKPRDIHPSRNRRVNRAQFGCDHGDEVVSGSSLTRAGG